jgi:hypothetical protein
MSQKGQPKPLKANFFTKKPSRVYPFMNDWYLEPVKEIIKSYIKPSLPPEKYNPTGFHGYWLVEEPIRRFVTIHLVDSEILINNFDSIEFADRFLMQQYFYRFNCQPLLIYDTLKDRIAVKYKSTF